MLLKWGLLAGVCEYSWSGVYYVEEVLSDMFPVQSWRSPEPRNVPFAEMWKEVGSSNLE